MVHLNVSWQKRVVSDDEIEVIIHLMTVDYKRKALVSRLRRTRSRSLAATTCSRFRTLMSMTPPAATANDKSNCDAAPPAPAHFTHPGRSLSNITRHGGS